MRRFFPGYPYDVGAGHDQAAICDMGFMVSLFAAPRPDHEEQIPLGRGAVARSVRIGEYRVVSTATTYGRF